MANPVYDRMDDNRLTANARYALTLGEIFTGVPTFGIKFLQAHLNNPKFDWEDLFEYCYE